jgi:hypothetical protein
MDPMSQELDEADSTANMNVILTRMLNQNGQGRDFQSEAEEPDKINLNLEHQINQGRAQKVPARIAE